MGDSPKLFLTEDVYLACMSLAYTTNRVDDTAFIVGQKVTINGKDRCIIGLMLYMMEIPMDKLLNHTMCTSIYKNAESGAAIMGTLCNQELNVVGWFHSHRHTLSADLTPTDALIFNNLTEIKSSMFCLIASVSTEQKQVHNATIHAYRHRNKNVQLTGFTIVPSSREVIFDKVFSFAQIFHALKGRELREWKRENENRRSEEYFEQILRIQKSFERYSCHIHRFVYPALQILIQDKTIIQSLKDTLSAMESK